MTFDFDAADERAAGTRGLNLATAPPLPIPADTANLRQGPEIHPDCLELLPLIGLWRGTGRFGNAPPQGPADFGQQLTFTHAGQPVVRYESVLWLLDASGAVDRPGAREIGWIRPGIDMALAHSDGRVELFHGTATGVASWQLSGTASARLYGVTATGALAYVDERLRDKELAPYASAVLERIVG